MASLSAPLSNQDIDRALAGAAAAVIEAATLMKQSFDYWYAAVTADNLAAGMLVTLGGAGTEPWTQAQFDHYSYNVAQLNTLLQVLTTGSPPPVDIVQPWSAQFRSAAFQP